MLNAGLVAHRSQGVREVDAGHRPRQVDAQDGVDGGRVVPR